MGYFNYFIKCIIRNISYKLCKPKVLLSIILIFLILFAFFNTSCFAADEVYQPTIVSPSDEFLNGVIQYDNTFYTLMEMQKQIQNNCISELYEMYNFDKSIGSNRTIQFLRKLAEEFYIISYQNNVPVGLYVLTDGGSNALYHYRICLYDKSNVEFSRRGNFIFSNTTFPNVTYCHVWNKSFSIGAENSFMYEEIPYRLEVVSAFTQVFVDGWKQLFIDTGVINTQWRDDIILKLDELIAKSNSTDSQIAQKLEEQNKLQEQQNQLQQEQNEILKDDNVNTDNFEFATDDTENPTTDGFNTLFTSVYNAFCNTSSTPLTITLPFVNQSFTISPNLVSNAMQKCGLGFVATLIHSFYYYSVCLFIYKDINKIIEHIKSGNLTADCGNVKTEVL